MLRTRFIFAAAIAALSSASAWAGIVPDGFNAENGGTPTLNYYSFADFTVSAGSVDLIGNGSFDAYAGNGLYVDMAGSTGQYGALTTNTALGAGNWIITIGLGGPIYSSGSYGVTQDGVRLDWGTGFQDFILPNLTTNIYVVPITLASSQFITVSDLGLSGHTYIGATLFGLEISRGISTEAVPEPASLALFGAGLAGLGAVHRRRKTA